MHTLTGNDAATLTLNDGQQQIKKLTVSRWGEWSAHPARDSDDSNHGMLVVRRSSEGDRRNPGRAPGRSLPLFRDRYQLLRPVVARAIERGEVPPGTDPLAVGRTLSAPLLTRVLVTGEDIDGDAAEEAANIAAAAARSGVLIPRP